ncbi:MAG: hypothetical protein ACI9JZ_001832 [Lentimonas sp.]|jgi:hypothetical protein
MTESVIHTFETLDQCGKTVEKQELGETIHKSTPDQ